MATKEDMIARCDEFEARTGKYSIRKIDIFPLLRDIIDWLRNINSGGSITGDGSEGNEFQLAGDSEAPDPENYYGTNAAGEKGFFPLPEIPEAYVNEDWTVIVAKDIEYGVVQEYILVMKARGPMVIDSLVHECDNGSLTGVVVKIDGVAVTGLDNLTIDTVETESAATANNLVNPGARVTLHTTVNYTGTPSQINVQLNFTR